MTAAEFSCINAMSKLLTKEQGAQLIATNALPREYAITYTFEWINRMVQSGLVFDSDKGKCFMFYIREIVTDKVVLEQLEKHFVTLIDLLRLSRPMLFKNEKKTALLPKDAEHLTVMDNLHKSLLSQQKNEVEESQRREFTLRQNFLKQQEEVMEQRRLKAVKEENQRFIREQEEKDAQRRRDDENTIVAENKRQKETEMEESERIAKSLKRMEDDNKSFNAKKMYNPSDADFSTFICKLDTRITKKQASSLLYSIGIYYNVPIMTKSDNVLSQLLVEGHIVNEYASLHRLIALLNTTDQTLFILTTEIRDWIKENGLTAKKWSEYYGQSKSKEERVVQQPLSNNADLIKFAMSLEQYISRENAYMMISAVPCYFNVTNTNLKPTGIICQMIASGHIKDTENDLLTLKKWIERSSSAMNYLGERVQARITRNRNHMTAAIETRKPIDVMDVGEKAKTNLKRQSQESSNPKNKVPRNGICIICNLTPIQVANIGCGCASKCFRCHENRFKLDIEICGHCNEVIVSYIRINLE